MDLGGSVNDLGGKVVRHSERVDVSYNRGTRDFPQAPLTGNIARIQNLNTHPTHGTRDPYP